RVEMMDTRHPEDDAIVEKLDGGNAVLEWLAHVQDSNRRVIEDSAQPWRGASHFILAIVPMAAKQRADCARGREAVDILLRVGLNDAAVREHDAENGSAGSIRRPPKKRRSDRARVERSGDHLRRL